MTHKSYTKSSEDQTSKNGETSTLSDDDGSRIKKTVVHGRDVATEFASRMTAYRLAIDFYRYYKQ